MLWRWHGDDWVSDTPRGGPLPQNLSVVTYNVWFEATAREERCEALNTLLHELRPDIVGLQEATLRMLRPLLERDWIREGYWCSASPTSHGGTHGVVLLSRIEPVRLAFDPLPGVMGRRLLWADFADLRLGVVHLESSPHSTPVRLEQLECVFHRLDEASHALLMGDFNQQDLSLPYPDLWPVLHPDDPGYTVDHTRNPFLRPSKAPVRFDRILLRSDRWQADRIELLGEGRAISDHFGLRAQLVGKEPPFPIHWSSPNCIRTAAP